MMTRVYILADDSMMGRSAATEYNAKGALYIEREVRRLGLRPARRGAAADEKSPTLEGRRAAHEVELTRDRIEGGVRLPLRT